MIEALRPGGVLLVQVLNLWRLPDGPCVWQKCLRTRLPQGDVSCSRACIAVASAVTSS